MKQVVYLIQWLEKIISRWQPSGILIIDDEKRRVDELVRYLVRIGEHFIEITSQNWKEDRHIQSFYDICILAFPNLDEGDSFLLKKIDDYLKYTSNALYLIAPVKSADSAERMIHPLKFNAYEMAMCETGDLQANLQIYVFWPTALPKLVEQEKTILACNPFEKKPLHILYYLPHIQLTGGLKCLLEQIRQLTKRGHEVSIIRRMGEEETHFLPTWFDLKEGKDVKNTYGIKGSDDVRQFVPENIDIVVVGWLSQLNEFIGYPGKVCLWEQGSQWLFGDLGEDALYLCNIHYYMQYIYTLSMPIISVSEVVKDLLETRYGKKTWVLTCGIDTQFYHPNQEVKEIGCPNILMMGSPYLSFKQIPVALRVLNQLYEEQIEFKVTWISPVEVARDAVPYEREIVISPPQEQLAEYYRKADVFLFTSLYEAFAMPPLEAMASGVPVVATDCGGIMTYARPGENAFICKQGDEVALVDGIKQLLREPKLRMEMGKKGRETALSLDYQLVGKRLEDILYTLCKE